MPGRKSADYQNVFIGEGLDCRVVKRRDRKKAGAGAARTNEGSGVVKEQGRLVVGDLENVLGELKTVVGDLRVLVNQIDEVTNKIDEEYGAELRSLEKRRKSDSMLEKNVLAVTNGLLVGQSASQPNNNIMYDQTDWLLKEAKQLLSSPARKKSGEKFSLDSGTGNDAIKRKERGSSSTSGYGPSPKELKNMCYPPPEWAERTSTDRESNSSPIVSQKRVHKSKSAHHKLHNDNRKSLQILSDSTDVSSHSCSMGRSKSTGTLDPNHTHCSPYSPNPKDHYCGVYERQLEMQLELEFDDNLENYNGVDDGDTIELESYREYKEKYRENINKWLTNYAMDTIQFDPSDLANDLLEDPTDFSSSDILNDNVASCSLVTTPSNYGMYTPWEMSPDFEGMPELN